jgi:hypothetical protein
MQLHARFFSEAGRGVPPDRDVQRILQTWGVGNVEHRVAELSTFITAYGITDLVTWAVPPGMYPVQIQASEEFGDSLVLHSDIKDGIMTGETLR